MTLTAKALSQIATFTRNSIGTYIGSSGFRTQAAVDEPRLDHDPDTLEVRGILIEPSATNYVKLSNDFSSATTGTIGSGGALPTGWFISGSPPNTEIVGVGSDFAYIDIRFSGTPTGTWNLYFGSIDAPTVDGDYVSSQVKARLTAGDMTNMSGLAARGIFYTSSAFHSIKTGSVVVPNSGYKTFKNEGALADDSAGTGTIAYSQAGMVFNWDGSGAVDFTVRLHSMQHEKGKVATSWIPTTGSTVTRAQDEIYRTVGSEINGPAGTLYVEAALRSDGNYNGLVTLDDGSGDNTLAITKNNTEANIYGSVVNGGASQVFLTKAIAGLPNTYKAALAFAENDFAFTLDGADAVTDASGSIPTITKIGIGQRSDGGSPINGHIKEIRYYPTRLTDAQIKALTA